jgi:hypothetical protein
LQVERFPLSSIKNRTSHSMVRNLFNPLVKIVLYSDGVISVDNPKSDSLIDKSNYDILNVHETKSITYSSAKYANRFIYVTLQTLTVLLSFLFLGWFNEFFLFVFENYQPSYSELAIFCAPIVYVFADYYRNLFAKPSLITIQTEDGETKHLTGKLPNAQLHTASSVMIALAAYSFFLGSVDKLTSTQYGSTVEIILGLIAISSIVFLIYQGYFAKNKINGIDNQEISNDMVHFYFALMSIKQSFNTVTVTVGKDISDELKGIKEELQQYDNSMKSVVSAEQIFTASNPSMGVLAIGISTETIMKNACERVGISFKPSAKMTLDPLIKQYNREAGIDSRIKSYLEIVKEMRNRAAHDFNINWTEFKTTLDQFCEIVKWYHGLYDESE